MKKANLALAVVAIVLALVLLGTYMVNLFGRECKSNKDCAQDAYCGSDFACHQYPAEIIVKQQSFVAPAIILGICLNGCGLHL